ncbi:MAG: cell division protein FtsL [Proteobacteria bacterium]|nr:cell division protein FtsL [Pseudomonadota bacterium]
MAAKKTTAPEKAAPEKAGARKSVFMAVAWTIMVAAILGEGFLWTWCHVRCRNVEKEIAAAWDSQAELLRMQERLRVELAHLESPERIMKIASNQLGLAMPVPGQVVVIHE